MGILINLVNIFKNSWKAPDSRGDGQCSKLGATFDELPVFVPFQSIVPDGVATMADVPKLLEPAAVVPPKM
eukprot:SAG31_NODE_30871_length_375_cov_0.710145_1_plen_71_part_10